MKKKITIIGEIGVNHNGNLDYLFKLTKIIKNSGAEYAKIQSFVPNNICTSKAHLAPYQKNKNKLKSQLDLLKKYTLNKNYQKKFFVFCKKIKIKPLASVFDFESADFIKENKLNIVKIPSGEINNLPLLDYVSKKFKKIILSTGLSNIKEITEAINVIKKNKILKKNLILMQCNTSYPSYTKDSNLNVISTFKKKFNLEIGYSDHTEDDISSITAVGLGATYFEKHITLSKNLSGPDHKASLNPKQFINYCHSIRKAEIALGSSIKQMTSSERKNIKHIRKSIYAKNYIKKGEIFSKNNLEFKRPAIGLSPKEFYKILGKKSKINYDTDDLIKKKEIN